MTKITETSTAYVAGEKLSILVARLDLPPEYAWFNELSAAERLDFFAGLLEVLTAEDLTRPGGRKRTRMTAINEYIRTWQATVELESSPELVEAVRQGIDDMEHGRLASREAVAEFLNEV